MCFDGGSWPDIYYCLTVTVLFLWGALSDERTGLSFIHADGPRQRSLSRVRVPWDSWPYFTVSDLRLPFSSPPTTRRVTVELFEPASTRVYVGSRQVASLHNLGTSRTENTASKNASIVEWHIKQAVAYRWWSGYCWRCSALWLPWKRVYRPLPRNVYLF
jgi:hypothetical protein